MSIFDSLNTSASSLTAQRLRMDVASSNISNAQTTRATMDENGDYLPYRRKIVSLQPNGNKFKTYLQKAKYGESSIENNRTNGVRVSQVSEDETPFKMVYDPGHPDADEMGMVRYPNVDPLKENVDMMSATRSYEANVTALNASKDLLLKALEIGQ